MCCSWEVNPFDHIDILLIFIVVKHIIPYDSLPGIYAIEIFT